DVIIELATIPRDRSGAIIRRAQQSDGIGANRLLTYRRIATDVDRRGWAIGNHRWRRILRPDIRNQAWRRGVVVNVPRRDAEDFGDLAAICLRAAITAID